MRKERGFGYCGLACCLCSAEDCPGCRKEGCPEKEWCKNFRCCREKGIAGCWACGAPCGEGMFQKVKPRAFTAYIKEYGEDALAEALKRNEAEGIVYHYKGDIRGDYDVDRVEEVFRLLNSGRK